jgi:hypothetical protein
LDNYLDGNFVRTALLYGLSLTGGSRLEPWQPGVAMGATADGECLVVALASAEPWSGRLRFDTPRHRQHLRLPLDFPRLNEWPEWFVVEAGRDYVVEGSASRGGTYDGTQLAAGLDVSLAPGREYDLRVCPR